MAFVAFKEKLIPLLDLVYQWHQEETIKGKDKQDFSNCLFNMPSDSDTLINYVNQHFQGYPVECCYEVSCCGFFPYRQLSQAGWHVKVLNPSDIPQSAKNKDQKSDRLDCRHLDKQLHSGHLIGIYIPDEQQ
ncbi:MAG TPA: hypothetical protein VK609_18665, partial [Mucilaginibacter sp.]|nr:hypothetical protein [Mucilaginibacter sp.]